MERPVSTAISIALGTVVGRLEGTNPDAPAILIGSHIDSVVDAGRYDGNLGVVLGIVAAEALRRGRHRARPARSRSWRSGTRRTLASRPISPPPSALAGRYDPAWLDGTDQHGVTLREALVELRRRSRRECGSERAGPGALSRLSRSPYRAGTAARGRRTCLSDRLRHQRHHPRPRRRDGEAGHAGTVPMTMRRDALAAVAEMIGIVERDRRRPAPTRSRPSASRRCSPAPSTSFRRVSILPLDARAPDDAVRHAMVQDIVAGMRGHRRKARRGFALEPFMDSPATPMDQGPDARSWRTVLRRSALPLSASPRAPGTTRSPWRISVPPRCCSCAARAASATTRRSRSRLRMPTSPHRFFCERSVSLWHEFNSGAFGRAPGLLRRSILGREPSMGRLAYEVFGELKNFSPGNSRVSCRRASILNG